MLCEVKSVSFRFFLFLLFAFAVMHGAATPASEVRLVARIAPSGVAADAPDHHAVAGNEMRATLWRTVEQEGKRMPLEGGALRLKVGENVVWPHDGCHGLHVGVKPTASVVAYMEPYSYQYHYVPRESFVDGEYLLPLRDLPEAATFAMVRVRAVEDTNREFVSELMTVPEAAQLQCAFALLNDWPTTEPAQYRFIVEVLAGGKRTPLHESEWTLAQQQGQGWQELALSLGAWAGQEVRIAWSCKAAGAPRRKDSVVPVWSTAQISAAGTADTAGPARPNIILISLDTLRADRLSSFGYPRPTTPALDAFAGEATSFTDAVAASCWTTPSHASMFTGALPLDHGAGSWPRGYVLQQNQQTIAELLQQAGYATAAFSEGGSVGSWAGFYQGFDRFSDGPVVEGASSGTAKRTFDAAAKWIDTQAGAPFFAFIHTFEIHDPYCSPPPEGHRFIDPDTQLSKCIFEKDLTSDAIVKQAIDLYDGGVLYTDAVFGQFAKFLKEKGFLDNTVVIIVSDHGEEFGEHGAYGHTTHLYKELLHVPVIIRLPDANAARGPQDTLISGCDIAPTIAEIAQVDVSPVSKEGRSLMPLLLPERGGSYTRDYAYSHFQQRIDELTLKTGIDHEFAFYSVRSKDARFMIGNREWVRERVLSGERPAQIQWTEFGYDLIADPAERTNVCEVDPSRMDVLRAVLKSHLEGKEIDTTVFPGVGSAGDERVQEETIDALRALGYID